MGANRLSSCSGEKGCQDESSCARSSGAPASSENTTERASAFDMEHVLLTGPIGILWPLSRNVSRNDRRHTPWGRYRKGLLPLHSGRSSANIVRHGSSTEFPYSRRRAALS